MATIVRGARESNVGPPPPGPDLIITAITYTPASPQPGDHVVFSATIQNIGGLATPAGTILDVRFTVDSGGPVTWSDTYTTSLSPGASVVLTANGGSAGVNYWTSTSGNHTVFGFVNAVNRITESDRTNNTFDVDIGVAAATSVPSAPVLTSATAGDHRVDLVFTIPANGGSPITVFGIQRTGGGDSGGIGFAGATATTYADVTALNGVAYTYTVTAQNANGSSVPSNALTRTPQAAAGSGADIVNGQAANKIIMWTGNQDPVQYGSAVRKAWKARGAGGFTVGNPYLVGFGGGSSWTAVPAPNLPEYFTQRELEGTQGGYGSVAMMHSEGLEVGLALKMHAGNIDTIPQAFAWSDRVNPPGTTPPDYSTKNVLFDAAFRADLVARFTEWATAARTLGVDFVTFDWEANDGHGNLNPPGLAKPFNNGYASPADGHTLAAGQAAAYQLGLEIGNALATGWPGYKFVNYSLYPPGGWNEEIQFIVNGVKNNMERYPGPRSTYHGRPSWHILRGMLDAGGYTWCEFFDHSFYKNTQIGGASWAMALKWNNEGCAAALSQYLSPSGWQYAAPRCFIKPFAWIDEHVGDVGPVTAQHPEWVLGNTTGEGLYAADRGEPSVSTQMAAFRSGGASELTGHTSVFMFARPGIVGVGGGNVNQAYMVRADGMGYTQGGANDPAQFIYDGYSYSGANPPGGHLPGLLASSQPGVVDSTLPTIANVPTRTRVGNTVTFTGIRISHPKGCHRLEGWVKTTPGVKFYATMVWDKAGGAYNTGIPNSALVCNISIQNAPPNTTVVLAAVTAQGQKRHLELVVA